MPLEISDAGDLCIAVLRDGEEIDQVSFDYAYDSARGVIRQVSVKRNNG